VVRHLLIKIWIKIKEKCHGIKAFTLFCYSSGRAEFY
jgi:hypothetical protein